MHLQKLPTIFVKGGEERKAYFTVQARELIADGWVEQGTEEPAPAAPEPVAEEAKGIKNEKIKFNKTESIIKIVEYVDKN